MSPPRRRTPFRGNRQITDYLYATSRTVGPEVRDRKEMPEMFEFLRRNGYTDARVQYRHFPGNRKYTYFQPPLAFASQLIYQARWEYDPLPEGYSYSIMQVYGVFTDLAPSGFYPIFSNLLTTLSPKANSSLLTDRPRAELLAPPTPEPTRPPGPEPTPEPTPSVAPTPTLNPSPTPGPDPPKPPKPPGSWIYSICNVTQNGQITNMGQIYSTSTLLSQQYNLSTTVRQTSGSPQDQRYEILSQSVRADGTNSQAIDREAPGPCRMVYVILAHHPDIVASTQSMRMMAMHW